jgi:hypothetical protein
MVTPAVQREAVAHLKGGHRMSERRACKTIGCDRMTVRYRSRRGDDVALRKRLRALAGPAAHAIAAPDSWNPEQGHHFGRGDYDIANKLASSLNGSRETVSIAPPSAVTVSGALPD